MLLARCVCVVLSASALASCGGDSPVVASAPPRDAGAEASTLHDRGVDAAVVATCARDLALETAIDDAIAFADTRVRATVERLRKEHPQDFTTYFPAITIPEGASGAGQWDLAPRGSPLISSRASDWRSGYFPGTLFAIHRLTGAADLLALARDYGAAIATLKDEPLDHDLGQRFLRSFGEDLDIATDANDPSGTLRNGARDILREAALTLDRRFDMNGVRAGAIRALDDYPPGPYPVYIDSMVNVPLLFDAYARADAPRRLYEHGIAHASTVMRDHVRANGSSYHIVQYGDGTNGTKKDGTVVAKISDQGFASESTWSRGQAWGIYGFTAVYRYTRDDPAVSPRRFRDAAEMMADYFLGHLPAALSADDQRHRTNDFVPATDFDAPSSESSRRDSSAAAITASALLELTTFASSKDRSERYRRAATDILRTLLTLRDASGRLVYLAKDSIHRGVLANAATSWNTPPVSLIYGDFHLLEAMRRYRALPCDAAGR